MYEPDSLRLFWVITVQDRIQIRFWSSEPRPIRYCKPAICTGHFMVRSSRCVPLLQKSSARTEQVTTVSITAVLLFLDAC